MQIKYCVNTQFKWYGMANSDVLCRKQNKKKASVMCPTEKKINVCGENLFPGECASLSPI